MPASSPLIPILVTVAAMLLLILIMLILVFRNRIRQINSRIEQLLIDHDRDVAEARKQSVNQSRYILKGKITEQMAPLLPGFLYEAADARFVGDPIDYVVFNGYTKTRDKSTEDNPMEIILLEVKQGSSNLTVYQKAIANAFKAGRVKFEVCRVSPDGEVSTKEWPLRIAKKTKEIE